MNGNRIHNVNLWVIGTDYTGSCKSNPREDNHPQIPGRKRPGMINTVFLEKNLQKSIHTYLLDLNK
jgi:hypothetical protein